MPADPNPSPLVTIYGLTDVSGNVRYIGRTGKTIEHRLMRHKWQARSKEGSCQKAVSLWIRDNSFEIGFVELQVVRRDLGAETELLWLRRYHEEGRELVNRLGYNWSPSPDQRASITASNNKRFSDPASRRHMSDLNKAGIIGTKGRSLTPEHRAKLSAAQKGVPKGSPSEETRRRMSESAKRRCARKGVVL